MSGNILAATRLDHHIGIIPPTDVDTQLGMTGGREGDKEKMGAEEGEGESGELGYMGEHKVADQLPADQSQAGVRGAEAITLTWSKRSLIVAYAWYVLLTPL
jgi:hypothetical protein